MGVSGAREPVLPAAGGPHKERSSLIRPKIIRLRYKGLRCKVKIKNSLLFPKTLLVGLQGVTRQATASAPALRLINDKVSRNFLFFKSRLRCPLLPTIPNFFSNYVL